MGLDMQILADEMYKMVAETDGIARYKPQDMFKEMIEKHKDNGVNKKDCKAALKTLIQSEKLTYTVLNGSCTSMVCLAGCEDEDANAEVTVKT